MELLQNYTFKVNYNVGNENKLKNSPSKRVFMLEKMENEIVGLEKIRDLYENTY
jgi:hypothetical protein